MRTDEVSGRTPAGGGPLGERLRDGADGEPVHFIEDAARGLLIDLGEGLRAQHILAAQHLEQVELDVPEVALVVAHGCLPGLAPARSYSRVT